MLQVTPFYSPALNFFPLLPLFLVHILLCTEDMHENWNPSNNKKPRNNVYYCMYHPMQTFHFTSSLEIRYRKVKLWGIHSMLLRDFASWHFLTLFLKDSGTDCWIISKTPTGHKPELFANASTILGRRILWSLRTPNVARMYSSFAASSSWNTLLGVYTRTWERSRKGSHNFSHLKT